MATEQDDVQAIIDTYVAANVIARMRESTVITRLVNTDFDDSDIKQEGDTIKVPKRGNLTARTKSEGTDITTDSPGTDTVDVTLNEHIYSAWDMGDLAKSLASGEGIEYFEDATDVLVEELETHLLELYSDAGSSVGAFGDDLTTDDFLDIKLEMDNNRCPRNGRVAVVSYKDENSLLAEDIIAEAHRSGDGGEAFRNAQLGRVYGFDIYASGLIPETGDSPTETHNMAFGPNGLAMATRPLEEPEQMTGVRTATITDDETGIVLRYMTGYDIKAMETIHVLDVLAGFKVLEEDRVVEVQS